jgi:hypothetical protein
VTRPLHPLLAACLAVAVLAPAAAIAGDAAAPATRPSRTTADDQLSQQEQLKIEWQTRYREAIVRERQARARLEAAEATYAKGRHREHLRGEPREVAVEELEAARAELEAARRQLEQVPQEARRAGVLPGWLREVEESLGAPAP